MKKDTLIAIGEALIDFIPNETGCDFENVTSFHPKVGGAPANVCGAFRVLGGKSKIITQLGDDPFGRKIEKELKNFGIDTSLISFTDKANTALAFVSLEKNGNRTFSFYRNPSADMLFDEEQITEEQFLERRQQEVKPLFENLHEWLLEKKNREILETSKTKQAINYCLNRWENLTRYLNYSYLTPSTNEAERTVRPFTLLRKNSFPGTLKLHRSASFA